MTRTLEAKCFRLSRSKKEYMKCDFNTITHQEGGISLDGKLVSQTDTFPYLGLMFQNFGDIRIKVDWLKWRQCSSVYCDPMVSLKLKGKFCRKVYRAPHSAAMGACDPSQLEPREDCYPPVA
jgi:hypothetical protein